MKKIILDNQPKIIKLRGMLEKELNVKVSKQDNEVYVDGLPENEHLAEKVIDAINFGFSNKRALLIKKKDLIFEVLNIKSLPFFVVL